MIEVKWTRHLVVTVSFFKKRPDAALPLKSKFHFQLDSVPWSIEKLFHLHPLKKDEIIISSSKMAKKNWGKVIQPARNFGENLDT